MRESKIKELEKEIIEDGNSLEIREMTNEPIVIIEQENFVDGAAIYAGHSKKIAYHDGKLSIQKVLEDTIYGKPRHVDFSVKSFIDDWTIVIIRERQWKDSLDENYSYTSYTIVLKPNSEYKKWALELKKRFDSLTSDQSDI